jgi:hypothetical protein
MHITSQYRSRFVIIWGIRLAVLLLITTATVGVVRATNVVTPNQFAATEGPGAINLLPGDPFGMKQLWIIDSSQFSALSGATQISELAMRPNGDSSFTGIPFPPTVIHNLEITIGTTTLPPANIDTDKNFADYLTNSIVAFNGNAAVSSSFSGPAGGPKAFDILFPFTTPFSYNPATGNLVVQFAVGGGDGIPSFVDGFHSPDTTFGRLFADTFSSTSGLADTFTPVLEFTTGTVVPPPPPVPDASSTLGLLLLGLAATFGLKGCVRRPA